MALIEHPERTAVFGSGHYLSISPLKKINTDVLKAHKFGCDVYYICNFKDHIK